MTLPFSTGGHFEPDPATLTRSTVRRYFERTWSLYKTCFGALDRAAFDLAPHKLRLPMSFYYGHTAAFYIQKLKLAGVVEEAGLGELDDKLERGVSPEDPDDLAGAGRWPDYETVRDYRRQARRTVLDAIARIEFSGKVRPGSPAWAVLMGVEHENIHLHTILPLIRMIPPELKTRPDGWPRPPRKAVDLSGEPAWADIPGGPVAYGCGPDKEGFGWDNEFGWRKTNVEGFQSARWPVTHAEYLRFVEDGGYERREFWRTSGADLFLDRLSTGRPECWTEGDDGGLRYRGAFEDADMIWSAPVEVNRHEASAYAAWAGARLIAEDEFHRLLDVCAGGVEGAQTLRDSLDIAFRAAAPRRVAPDAAPGGVDFLGNVALWAADDFSPLAPDAFTPDPLYPDFSEPWFGPQTGQLLGASYAMCGHMGRIGVMRDFMQNHMGQIAGIFLVRARYDG